MGGGGKGRTGKRGGVAAELKFAVTHPRHLSG